VTDPDFDWWLERVDISEWKNHAPGRREVMAVCPVHGGGSLHIEEKAGKALVHCFGCDAKYGEIREAAEAGEEAVESAPSVTIGLTSQRVATGQRASTQAKLKVAPQDVTSATSATKADLEWVAKRCGMTLAELGDLKLPLEPRGQRIAFTFGPGVEKLRGAAEGKRKDILWVGGYTPPLWPVPTYGLASEVVVCEGEFDAIVLRAAGYAAYSITGGASNVPSVSAFHTMRNLGVERIHVLFDEDDAGRKGRDAVLEAIREADIETVPSRVVDIQPLMGEKDVRDVALRVGAKNVQIEDAITDEVHTLGDVDAVQPEPLLLDYLHPHEHTILYGDGGTGKGVIAAWWVAQLVAAEDKRVLIVDYEAHAQHEWRPRLEAFLTEMKAESKMSTHVYICQPTKPIWEVGDWLRDMARRVQADYIVVDSVTYACIKDVEVAETAIKYSGTIARLGLPVLSLGHVTKADANPRHPFGSVYWSNGARVTIAVSRLDNGDRKLMNFKSNQRSEFKPKGIKWDWVDQQDGPPKKLEFYDLALSAREQYTAMIEEFKKVHGRQPDAKEGDALRPDDVTAGNWRQARARWLKDQTGISLKSGKP
jgi:5S rRNA maturation endonuclease (ribonuclease M5)